MLLNIYIFIYAFIQGNRNKMSLRNLASLYMTTY